MKIALICWYGAAISIGGALEAMWPMGLAGRLLCACLLAVLALLAPLAYGPDAPRTKGETDG